MALAGVDHFWRESGECLQTLGWQPGNYDIETTSALISLSLPLPSASLHSLLLYSGASVDSYRDPPEHSFFFFFHTRVMIPTSTALS